MGRSHATRASGNADVEDAIVALRNIVREKMDEIKQRASEALREQGIEFSVFILVPGSDRAVVLVGTIGDPPDRDWELATTTVGSVVEEIIGLGKTSSSEIMCLEVDPHGLTHSED